MAAASPSSGATAQLDIGDFALVCSGENSGQAGTVASSTGALVVIVTNDGRRLVERAEACALIVPARPAIFPHERLGNRPG